ncbi:hypothetical protein MTO96_007909 [Rhipicephalus appendiculatus]
MTQRNPTSPARTGRHHPKKASLAILLSPGKEGPCDDPLMARAAGGGRALAIIGDGRGVDHVRRRRRASNERHGSRPSDRRYRGLSGVGGPNTGSFLGGQNRTRLIYAQRREEEEFIVTSAVVSV